MGKFTIKRIAKIGATKIGLYKLAIDKICQIDVFENAIGKDSALSHEVDKIYATLEFVCNLTLLPKTMYRVLQLGDLPFRVYEVKSSNLRYYLIKLDKIGKVIVLGGRKKSQKEDLKHLTILVKTLYTQEITKI